MALSACGASGCKVIIRLGPGRCGAPATNRRREFIARLLLTKRGRPLSQTAKKMRAPFVEDLARLGPIRPGEAATDISKLGECVVRVADCNK